MNLGIDGTDIRTSERRRKRLITPIIYLMAEAVVAWLILSLIQLEFYLQNWNIWAMVLFILGAFYSIAKTLHIYNRQKDYPKENENK